MGEDTGRLGSDIWRRESLLPAHSEHAWEAHMLSRWHVRLCDSMDCSLPGSSVHGILQARILEWVAISSFRGSSRPRDRTRGSCCISYNAGSFLTAEPPGKPMNKEAHGQRQVVTTLQPRQRPASESIRYHWGAKQEERKKPRPWWYHWMTGSNQPSPARGLGSPLRQSSMVPHCLNQSSWVRMKQKDSFMTEVPRKP